MYVLDQPRFLNAVAERWENSADGLTWTFHLRPNAQWSNGDPVTAHDFVFAYRRILTPSLAAEYASLLYVLKNGQPLLTDNGQHILDVSGLHIRDPLAFEAQVSQWPGVVTVGVFAFQRAQVCLLGTPQGVKTLNF